MASICPVLPVFLVVLAALATTSNSHGDGNLTLRCHPDQAATLLQLKKSFSFLRYPSPLESWQDGTDCCLWEGVGCSNSSGYVTALELGGCGLYSQGLDPAIFRLTSLQLLDLSMNDFGLYSLPASGFERLSLLTHLNLSNSGFQGQIPIGIVGLVNLISLDLSGLYEPNDDSVYGYDSVYNLLSLQEPSFQILLANLSNLRELYLDGVDMSSSGDWCHALAKSLPHLRVLSLSSCQLRRPICPLLSNLHSLTVINLQDNFYETTAPFPEFFMDFLNLSVLRLGSTNLQGWFPCRTFESKTLRVLDLSFNENLSGHMPNFSNTSSLETMMLDVTNFSFGKPGSFSNFKSLQALSLDVDFAFMEHQSSLGIHTSLRHLELTQMDSTKDLGLILSWIGDLQNLASLELRGWNFSWKSFSSVAKLKNLRSLSMYYCSFTKPLLPAIGNLVNLRSLVIHRCELNGPMPSAIGDLADLESLEITADDFLGPIPSAIGNLRSLKSLEINAHGLLGPIPSSIGNLSSLIRLEISASEFSGPMPAAICNLSNLEALEIYSSGFSGPIPYAVGLLKKLTSLWLRECSFSGKIPNSVFNLTRLIELDLSFNLLSGEVPASVFTIPTLQHLDIQSNQLSGSIQDFNATSSHLLSVDLSTNELTGNIPMSFFQLTSLVYLDIGWNNLVGLVDLSLFRSSNQLQGQIPMPSPSAFFLDYSNNNFSSVLPNFTFYLGQEFRISKNKISGHIPNSICDSTISVLDLSFNNFSGQIPSCLIEDGYTSVLNLRENQFGGVLPNNIKDQCFLHTLDLNNNKIEGQLPRTLTKCLQLEFLDVGNNHIVGTFPTWLGILPRLRVLVMRSNRFYGSMGGDLHSNDNPGEYFSSLQVLDVASNNFFGNLSPDWFEGLKSMMAESLSGHCCYIL
ncbi:unnamed protein product [Triticum turgidum subsp. durum]|uniref:Leucine-rich repeat-containing N-terminal plant-type domain-containing protein n=1 Tax=Triticum turgidum subsp. durum TaxID=4567 RepID=A0A9R1RWD9_TRITD|nr:unnamed protein product [Triticum turgidum subsp. durum]